MDECGLHPAVGTAQNRANSTLKVKDDCMILSPLEDNPQNLTSFPGPWSDEGENEIGRA